MAMKIRFKITVTFMGINDEYEDTITSGYTENLMDLYELLVVYMKAYKTKKALCVNAYTLINGKPHKYKCNRQLIIKEEFLYDRKTEIL